jgi:hypothetical protein
MSALKTVNAKASMYDTRIHIICVMVLTWGQEVAYRYSTSGIVGALDEKTLVRNTVADGFHAHTLFWWIFLERRLTCGVGGLFQFDDEDNVYELMDDDQYGELVRQRRQREDFVVDDGTPPRPPPTLGPKMGLI